MKYLIIFVVFCSSTLFLSCGKDNSIGPNDEIPLSERLEAYKYYPYRVGNYWRYRYTNFYLAGPGIKTTGTFSVEVIDSIIKNNRINWVFQMKDIYSQTVDYDKHVTTEKIGDDNPHSFIIYPDIKSGGIIKFDSLRFPWKEVLIENTFIAAKDTMFGFIPCYKTEIMSGEPRGIICKSITNDIFLGLKTSIKFYTGYDWGEVNYKIAKNLGYIYGYSLRRAAMARYIQIEETLEYAKINGIEYK